MGYYINTAKFAKNKTEEKSSLKRAFFVPFLIHGTYNSLVFSVVAFAPLLVLLAMIFMAILYFAIRGSLKEIKQSVEKRQMDTEELAKEAEVLEADKLTS